MHLANTCLVNPVSVFAVAVLISLFFLWPAEVRFPAFYESISSVLRLAG